MQGGSRVRRWLILALLWGVALLFLIPFLWMLSSSLKPNYQIFEVPPRWIPNPPRWENYVEALTILPFPLYIRNTAIITLLTIAGHLLSCTVIAYAFARLRAPGRDFLFVVMLATMMLPYPVTMVPLYVLFNRLGWINTFLPLVVPAYLGIPFYIFLMRQFFLTIPRDFEDAARVDGANEWEVFLKVVVPLSWPGFLTVGLVVALSVWNEFLLATVFLTDQERFTVVTSYYNFTARFSRDWGLTSAAAVMMIAPILVIFLALQRRFIDGLTQGGLKA
ncbi:MAG: carbohydrate ABC transporter permease [Caldilineaceae bacterium]|nr:carbohydrate ABC transporter permease [Caldilineaceae bacterium]